MSVKIYSKPQCKFCTLAKEFFKNKNIPYEEVLLDPKTDEYHDVVDELLTKTNHKTFPFIFVGDQFVGGYTDLMAAFDTLRLHDLLKAIGITLDVDDF